MMNLKGMDMKGCIDGNTSQRVKDGFIDGV